MRTRVHCVGWLSASLAALVLTGSAPRAQTAAPRPAITLPPQPEILIDLGAAPARAPEPAPRAQAAAMPVAPAAQIPATPPPAPAPIVTAEALQAALAAQAAAARADPAARGPRAATTRQREAAAAFYAARGFAPLWIDNGDWTPAARAMLALLDSARDDGLDLRATPRAPVIGGTAAALASADFALSVAVANYGWQASGGRVDPKSIAKLITEQPAAVDPMSVLTRVTASADPAGALRDFNPPQPGYAALRDKLMELRRGRVEAVERVPAGPALKVGMRDGRAPLLRARFGIAAPEGVDDLTYDEGIAHVVWDFQRANGIAPTGQLNPRTVAALNGNNPASVEDEIVANMERWRWEPRAQTHDVIEVNIPDFTVKVTLGGALVHKARVVVGKPDTPTPVFSNKMQFLEVNPYWNVPESIIEKEMKPKLAQDPAYLQRMGYEVTTSKSGKMIVRQPPGERNALGRIKFMFPNEHAVYLHDTPSRGYFNAERRAYSHGCVRVDQPFKLAEIVLGGASGWNEARIKKLIGGKNQTIQLPAHIDIHIEYFTAFIDETGQLRQREDIYGYSRKVRAALGLAG